MFQIVKIPKKFVNEVNKEIYSSLNDFLGVNIKNHSEIFKIIKKKTEIRSQIFDLLNMLPVLGYINYEIKKILEKKILRKNLVNWTYAQIRLDDFSSKKFSSPAHKDKWVIDPKKKGYVVWMPLFPQTASLLISKNHETKKIKINKYWGLECIDKIDFKKIKINFGEALIFDDNTLHKSCNLNNSKITLQLRYEEMLSKKFIFRRSATQKIDQNVLNFWKKKLI